jgi:hypothetical protein
MRFTKFLLVAAISLVCVVAKGQDKIYLKDGKIIEAWIQEKNDKEIVYKVFNTADSPTVVVRTRMVDKIVFRNGQETSVIPQGVRMSRPFAANVGPAFTIGSENIRSFKFQVDYTVSQSLSFLLNGLLETEGGGGMAAGAMYFFDSYRAKPVKGYASLQLGVFQGDFLFQGSFGISLATTKGFDLKFGLSSMTIYKLDFDTYIMPEILIGWRF